MKINYAALKTGDVVITGAVGIFGRVIRAVSKGWAARRERGTVATHVGIIVEWEGQKLVAEMLSNGLRINSLKRYTTERRRFILGVVRPAGIRDHERALINSRIARDYRVGLDYDWAGVINFVSGEVEHNPYKFFCSEYVASILKEYTNTKIHKHPYNVFPSDFQVPSNTVQDLFTVNWRIAQDV